MKNSLLLFSFLLVFGAKNASAQNYPSTDSLGNKVYYKIVSAYPEYSKMCIVDNTRKAGSTGYKFTIEEMQDGVYVQEWQIVAAANDDSGTYFLRNRSTLRYISPVGAWKDNFYAQEASGTKINLKSFVFEDLKDNQISIKFADGDDVRYLFAADSAGTVPSLNEYGKENSVWAWNVCTTKGVPVSVSKIIKDNNVKIQVVDRVIKVEGADVYTIMNNEGMLLNKDQQLMPGIYFVNAKGISYKVLVK